MRGPEEKQWAHAAENKVTFVSDWLIDGVEFIVERPVGHTAPTRNLAHTETAVLESAACANCGNICVLCGASLRGVCVWICALRPRLQAKLIDKLLAAAEMQRRAFLLKRSTGKIHINCLNDLNHANVFLIMLIILTLTYFYLLPELWSNECKASLGPHRVTGVSEAAAGLTECRSSSTFFIFWCFF